MLDSSLALMNDAPLENRRVAEILAFASLKAQLEENLIPVEEALATAQEHRHGQTEEWTRAVYAALVGLQELRGDGYAVMKA